MQEQKERVPEIQLWGVPIVRPERPGEREQRAGKRDPWAKRQGPGAVSGGRDKHYSRGTSRTSPTRVGL